MVQNILIVHSPIRKFPFVVTVACLSYQCPTGSQCRMCNTTGLPYCEYSCDVDNGGCAEGLQCSQSQVTCAPNQCCSPSITCQCKYDGLIYYKHIF